MTERVTPVIKNPAELDYRKLVSVVSAIQAVLWFGTVGHKGKSPVYGWDPNKEWDADIVDSIARVLEGVGLKPARKDTF